MNLPRDARVSHFNLRRMLSIFILGALTAIAVAYSLALLVDPRAASQRVAQTALDDSIWTISCWRRFGVVLVEAVSQSAKRQWGTEQAIGPPDTVGAGDIVTAWASRSPDGQPEWLILDYAESVDPARIDIIETFNPGAVAKVTVFTPDGDEVTVWNGVDPTLPINGRGTSQIPVRLDLQTRRVKIYLDSPKVPGWNEIDAVALIDHSGKTQWAVAAAASSTYASQVNTFDTPDDLIPGWCPLLDPRTVHPLQTERRLAAGFGWPLVTLHCSEVSSADGQHRTSGMFAGTLGSSAANRKKSPPIPYHVIWPNLVLNGMFYAVVLTLIYIGLTRPLRLVKQGSRARQCRCAHCGYDLRFDLARGCPECGWRREPGHSEDVEKNAARDART